MPLFFHLLVLLFSLLRLSGAPEPGGDPPADDDDKDIDEEKDLTKLKEAIKAERKLKRDAETKNKTFEKEKADREAAEKKQAEEKAKADGKFEELATKAQKDADDLRAQLAKRDADALRAKVAAKHKLPDALADRLRGETEADLEADAKELAKLKIVSDAPKTETGKTNEGDGKPQGGQDQSKQQKPYIFQNPGDVPW